MLLSVLFGTCRSRSPHALRLCIGCVLTNRKALFLILHALSRGVYGDLSSFYRIARLASSPLLLNDIRFRLYPGMESRARQISPLSFLSAQFAIVNSVYLDQFAVIFI